MPLSRAFLKTLNPGSMKPGVDYAVFLLKPSGAPHAVVDIVDEGGVAIYTGTCTNGLDTLPFENTTKAIKGFFKEIDDCITNAIRSGAKPNCGSPEINEAVKTVQSNPRDRQALERLKCLHVSTYVGRIINTASSQYAIIRNLNPCGFGSLILLPGNGIYELPVSKLEIARFLGRLQPDYIQVEEGWNKYTHLAHLILKAPRELLPHVTALAGRAFNVKFPEDRIEAYITVEALLSKELGYMAVIDFEGDAPFIVKFPRAPFKPDEP
jgi:hypothetical protein